jgi:hypothetical protein
VGALAAGSLAHTRGFDAAVTMTSIAFLVAAGFSTPIRETRGRIID